MFHNSVVEQEVDDGKVLVWVFRVEMEGEGVEDAAWAAKNGGGEWAEYMKQCSGSGSNSDKRQVTASDRDRVRVRKKARTASDGSGDSSNGVCRGAARGSAPQV
jgi:hypothetical protein